MKVAHLTGSVSTLGGGIALALRSLVNAQQACGIDPLVFAPEDGGETLPEWPPGLPEILPARRFGPVLWGKNLPRHLEKATPDLVHTHGLWGQPSVVVGSRRASQLKRVVSPHGMLDPWALGNGRLRKKLAMLLFERRCLRKADCLHALCLSEAQSIRALGLRNPVAIIPNGVDLPARVIGEEKSKGCKVLLFLGRLHPKKGLPNALEAFAQMQSEQDGATGHQVWQLVVAGWDQGGHQEELEGLCRELGLSFAKTSVEEHLAARDRAPDTGGEGAQVVFTGPAFGEEKDRLLRHANAFILPSFSEGLPVAVLEAWAYELPVLMTEHCNLPEGFAAEAAFLLGTDVQSIAAGMRELLQTSPEALQRVGANGRQLVEKQFTWPQVATQMKTLYQWVLNGGPPPDFVETI